VGDVGEVEPGDREGEHSHHQDRPYGQTGAPGGAASIRRVAHGKGVYQRLRAYRLQGRDFGENP
jgi:hypothetical protein